MFAGDASYLASSTLAQFTVVPEAAKLQVTAPSALAVANVRVTASLLDDGQSPIRGRTVKFSARDQVVAATTDSNGIATALLALQPGQYTPAASFDGDLFYQRANAPGQTLYVYQTGSRRAITTGA